MPWWWTKRNQSTRRVANNLRLTCRICKYFVFVSILRGCFLKAKRSFHLFCISYLWGQCAGCLIRSVLPGAWRPVCRDGLSWHPEHPIKLWTRVRRPKSSGSGWGQRAFLCALFLNYLCMLGQIYNYYPFIHLKVLNNIHSTSHKRKQLVCLKALN